MTIPSSTYYPTELDTDTNLFTVHDALRMQLAEDYTPGDKSITVTGDPLVMVNFPPTGIITLTDQCSEIDLRALTFYYGSRTDTTFDELELYPEFIDVEKPNRLTDVTMNVTAPHHNNIKDALIEIEKFLGIKGTMDTKPLGPTIEGRLNFMSKLVFTPRAWFTVDKRIGLVPFTVTFKDESIRLGNGDVTYLWDFGDQTNISVISTISETSVVPSDQVNVVVYDLDGGTITKTFNNPGTFDVKLIVTNQYGQDTVILPGLINARIEAPDEAVIEFIPNSDQNFTNGTPIGGPYVTPPKIRSTVNEFIDFAEIYFELEETLESNLTFDKVHNHGYDRIWDCGSTTLLLKTA